MKKTERYVYPAIFTYKAGQEIAVVFPDLMLLQAAQMITMRCCPQENCWAVPSMAWRKIMRKFPHLRRCPI